MFASHRLSHRLALVLVLAGAVVAPQLAHADDPAERSAHRHFERGEKLYNLKKYDEALAEYQKAFDASPIPDFLFNIAQCYRNLDNYEDAVFTYKRFLQQEPDAPNRDKVERLISDLEKKIDRAHGDEDHFKLKKQPRELPPTVTETPDQPVYKKWWFWTGVAVVAVGGGVGVYAATRSSTPGTDFAVVWPR